MQESNATQNKVIFIGEMMVRVTAAGAFYKDIWAEARSVKTLPMNETAFFTD